MITLIVGSFLAGMLTILAPCVLPLLPVIVGGGISSSGRRDMWRPVFVVLGLALSVIAFTLLLKATTALLGVPQELWQYISGVIVILIGVSFALPDLWERLPFVGKFSITSQQQLGDASRYKGVGGALLIGAALGPVFNSCSPTYAFIVATVLPVSFATGMLYLTAYALGMAAVLLAVIYAGRALISKLGWALNPHGIFRRSIGVLFILVGVAVIFGFDKDVQAFLLEQGFYDGSSAIDDLFSN